MSNLAKVAQSNCFCRVLTTPFLILARKKNNKEENPSCVQIQEKKKDSSFYFYINLRPRTSHFQYINFPDKKIEYSTVLSKNRRTGKKFSNSTERQQNLFTYAAMENV